MWALAAQAALGQVGQERWVGRASHKGFQHLPSRGTKDIARHITELDARAFERLLDAVTLGGPLSDQRRAIAGQFTQFPLWAVRHEAGSKQTVS